MTDAGVILPDSRVPAPSPSPPDSAHKESLRLVCREVWGGNRRAYGPIALPGVRGVLYSKPCSGGRGGDVHFLSVCGSGLLSRMCIADVTGHGEKVAKVSETMHAHLQRCINWTDQRKVLRDLNVRLARIGLDSMTTAAAMTYFPPTGRLSISYAGHEPGWFYDCATDVWERFELLEADARLSNLPLAVERKVRYSRRSVRVQRGDRLLMVTDGVLEAGNPVGEKFGPARVTKLLQQHRHLDCAALGARLIAALHAHTQTASLEHDDVTFLLIEFTNDLKGSALWQAIKNRLLRPRGNSDASRFQADAS